MQKTHYTLPEFYRLYIQILHEIPLGTKPVLTEQVNTTEWFGLEETFKDI